jgi:hypothetical protein
MLSRVLWVVAGAMTLLGIISPSFGENWKEVMDSVWFPLLAAILIVEIALGITQHEEARKWHQEEMAQWRLENGNPGKEEDSK